MKVTSLTTWSGPRTLVVNVEHSPAKQRRGPLQVCFSPLTHHRMVCRTHHRTARIYVLRQRRRVAFSAVVSLKPGWFTAIMANRFATKLVGGIVTGTTLTRVHDHYAKVHVRYGSALEGLFIPCGHYVSPYPVFPLGSRQVNTPSPTIPPSHTPMLLRSCPKLCASRSFAAYREPEG